MKTHKGVSALAVLLVLLSPLVTTGDDMFPPPWRGQDRTSFQHWTFDDNDDPAFPEYIVNPYGDAWADITVLQFGLGWRSSVLGRNGIWADLEETVLAVDNVPDPEGRKELWIQVTYYFALSVPPDIDVVGGAFVGGTTVELESYGLGAWYLRQEVWEIFPNPDHEAVVLSADPSSGFTMDQIIVDTICIPPPVISNMVRNSSGNAEITWQSSSACTYTVESCTTSDGYNGSGTVWSVEASGITGGEGTTTWEDTLASGVTDWKFYRVCQE